MVLGVFLAAFLVGLIYYVLGIGSALGFRERMQDAADSGAFAAATMSARGMNLIVLINIAMVVVLSMSSTARLVYYMAGLAGSSGATAPVAGLDDSVPVLESAQSVSEALADTMPAVVEARALAAVVESFRPPVETVFVYQTQRLPLATASSGELVSRAEEGWVSEARKAFTSQEMNRIYEQVGASELVEYGNQQPAAIVGGRGIGPQQLVPGANLGGDAFQVRVVAGGGFNFARSSSGVGIATWGDSEEATRNLQALRLLSQIAVAQAEFYFDGGEARSQWMWHQNWRARMRRVRLSDPGQYPCAQPSKACDGLNELFRRGLFRAVVH